LATPQSDGLPQQAFYELVSLNPPMPVWRGESLDRDAERYHRHARELTGSAPNMIWASASQSVAALQQGTQSVPIVRANVIDPVGAGFVASLARPAAIIDVYRHAVDYSHRILRGAKPADLAVQAPTKYELVLNLKTAKVLGLICRAKSHRLRRRGNRIDEQRSRLPAVNTFPRRMSVDGGEPEAIGARSNWRE
jgi:ABC-type uncharacterized transport system substrate-binding protein